MTYPKWLKNTAAMAIVAALVSACASDGGHTPAPLTKLTVPTPVALAWKADLGRASFGRFSPVVLADTMYAVGEQGDLLQIETRSGQIVRRVKMKDRLSSGVAADAERVYVVNHRAQLLALTAEGESRWSAQLSSLTVGRPVVAGSLVLVQTQDGRVTAFESETGKLKWFYQYALPALTIQNAGALYPLNPEIALLGLPSGRVAVLHLMRGEPLWEAPIMSVRGANELERIADIASPPMFDGAQVCAVAFQGRLSCLDARTGAPVWSQPVSSSQGLTFDAQRIYVTADDGQIHTFDRQTGRVLWVQDILQYRRLSAPARLGDQLVVYDDEGLLHTFSASTGELTGRLALGTGLAASRLMAISAEQLLLQTQNGKVLAFKLAS